MVIISAQAFLASRIIKIRPRLLTEKQTLKVEVPHFSTPFGHVNYIIIQLENFDKTIY
jgi:hypothetical protein